MNKKTTLMYGSLLHDIGKIVYRSNQHSFAKGTHSKLGADFLSQFKKFDNKEILECIRYHHYKELKNAKVADDSNAYITYVADNIASGIDRRDVIEEGEESQSQHKLKFDKFTPLYSVFNVVNSENKDVSDGKLHFENEKHLSYPSSEPLKYTSSQYNELVNDMTLDIRHKLKVNSSFFPSFLQWTESLWQFVPSSTNKNQLIDISLYDHSRITCAIASSMYDYFEENHITNYKKALFSSYDTTKKFYQEKAFILLSMDMSGIQEFIYNISGSKALKSLRSRSFYLELMLEVIVDQFLDSVNLSRANLLYTGGGHAYLLLPNTDGLKKQVLKFSDYLKEWFMKEFTTDLSISIAYEPCSGEDLMNTNGEYKNIWRNLSLKLSDKKAHKYTAADILKFNKGQSDGERECKECLRSDISINDDGLCSICEGIINISNDLRDKSFFILADEGILKMPFDKKVYVIDDEAAEKLTSEHPDIQIYSKNNPYVGVGVSRNLWMCDYDYASTHSQSKDKGISSYVDRLEGVQRLGVLRADVDNLGNTFINGIPEKYNSISRTATLSRQLSLFFKYELNNILEELKITSIYSGGDDLFLVGAWDDIVKASIEIREHFRMFTLGKLTLSAGIGIFHDKYPISKMAFETGQLEGYAKTGEKNQVALWTEEKVYNWDELKDDILHEKLEVIRLAFESSEHHGKAFLYKILVLLRNDEAINIARLAYLLSRSQIADEYTSQIFQWAQENKDKNHLITAIEYYIYQTREADVQ
ncbi:type III-A CRISPR-associated protein Cas10/Csm1 [Staphylococcus rostri]|uniref:CRISPR system single-strand-specific deoxyribonuclease Cas10/Csm1 (subtype III-A) n=1 Tax=Staphylococcus rostri TaxID=522262 RepID=A0A2K3YJP4_9STAP|nr:type III-A CRISPR-associated protein Cas10/Csm1 [Staphylococcus rostri]PNZ25817.1 type III-A CRISPR-associated protein Cas10/Csm1 [Staphylococcus rostri]